MKRLLRSEGYARARLFNGALFALLGTVVVVRTLATTGPSWGAIPGCVLGAAMIALGVLRYRDYFGARGRR